MPDVFKYSVLPNNTAGAVIIPVTQAILPIASLTTNVGPNLLVSLRATVGWRAVSGISNVIFKIWLGAPETGRLLYSVEESAETSFDNFRVTSFAHVDSGFTSTQQVTYTLTVETPNTGNVANIIGPRTFTTFITTP